MTEKVLGGNSVKNEFSFIWAGFDRQSIHFSFHAEEGFQMMSGREKNICSNEWSSTFWTQLVQKKHIK